MDALFITATGTNIGKTYSTLKLIEYFSKKGLAVGVYKPIETGVLEYPVDASLLLESCQKYNKKFKDFQPKDITAYTFELPSAPFCADIKNNIKISRIIEKYEELKQLCDILLVEGAGGLYVPITQNFMMIDLIKKLDIKTLLITPSRLGCINDTLLSIEALKSHHIDFDWLVNLYEDKEDFDEVSKPYYEQAFEDCWTIDDISNIYARFNDI